MRFNHNRLVSFGNLTTGLNQRFEQIFLVDPPTHTSEIRPDKAAASPVHLVASIATDFMIGVKKKPPLLGITRMQELAVGLKRISISQSLRFFTRIEQVFHGPCRRSVR